MNNEMIEAIITAVGGTAILLAAVGWLVRSLIGQYLSKDLESYKEQLRSQTQLELENLKSKLAINAASHNIKFSRLHEKQAKLVEKLYFDVDRLDQLSKLLIGVFVSDTEIKEKENRAKGILEEYLELNAKFHKNKLYFTPELYSLLTSYSNTVFEPATVLLEDIPDNEKEDFMSGYTDNHEHNTNKLETLRTAIENEFRGLLGVV